ncbi:MAG: type IV pilin N-terminal domain-containing protein [Methanomicrobium sp.]|nr:type IV pilin N-terminal domain-containing protein [Methanomicrobium sp.]
MKRSNIMDEEAVSPVVGVMLMLVVTIIIAAIVAGFSGGVVGSEKSAPQSSFVVGYNAQITDTDKTNAQADSPKTNNGLTFRLVSGDTVSLDNIMIELQSGADSIKFTTDTILNTSAGAVEENNKVKIIKSGENPTYFAVLPNMDEVIAIGDSFMLLADGSYDSTLATDPSIAKGRFLTWSPEGSSGVFKVKQNVAFDYAIYDTVSNKIIQSGTVTIQ